MIAIWDRLIDYWQFLICTLSGNNFEYQGDRPIGLRRLKQTSVLRLGSYIQSTAVLNSLGDGLKSEFFKRLAEVLVLTNFLVLINSVYGPDLVKTSYLD
jgi:hypothetical protein